MSEPQKTEQISTFPPAALRMIDANRNRAAEGLRVVEDYCRFGLGDHFLTSLCKNLRHELATTLAVIPETALAAARETQQDVGTRFSTPQEVSRRSLADVATAACQRVQQALRVIEESLKLVDVASATKIESLRYRIYTLAKALISTAASRERLANARLYVLVDGKRSECEFVECVQTLVESRVDVIQLRDKQLDDRTLLGRARLLRRVIEEATRQEPCPQPPLFTMNDRPDLAVLARADGVHVGQEELSVHDARQIVGAEMLVGVSTHTIEQARQAVLDGANYIGCGPVFPSQTKPFDQFPGLEFLRQVAEEISLPAFAIGGVTRQNLPQVLEVGFRRVAIGGAIVSANDTLQAARMFMQALGSV